MNVTASLVHHDHYPESWYHYQLFTPVYCGWLRTDDPVSNIVIAHLPDPLDGERITQVTHAGHDGQPGATNVWRTLDGDQVTTWELVRWILTRHATVERPSHQIRA